MSTKKKNKSIKGLLLGICLLITILTFNILLGSRMIFSGDFFYLADQARDMLLTQDIVENKNVTLIGTHSGLGGFFHGPLWLYLLAPVYLIGGGNPQAFLFVYVLIAIVTVLVGYFAGASLYNKKVGLLFAFLLAVSPSIWSFIPNTIGVNMVPLVFIAMFYFLVRYLRGNNRDYIFAIFFAGLSLQFETALPLVLIPVVLASFFLNKNAIKDIKLILLSLGSLLLSLATFVLFELRHDFLMMRSLLTVFTGGEKQQGYLGFPERLVDHVQALRGVYESMLITKAPFLETLFVAIILLLAYLFMKDRVLENKEKKEFLYLVAFPVFIFIFYTFYAYPIFIEYTLGLSIPVTLAFAVALHKLWPQKVGRVLVILFIAFTVFEAGKIIVGDYFRPYTFNNTSGTYRNQKQVADWIFEDSRGKPFGYYVYTPSTYTYGMDYLLWWDSKVLGQTKPESEKLPTTYLILYPTLDNDKGAHTFWKKAKIKTSAEVVARKQFEGGIIVEKLKVSPTEPPADPTYHQDLIFR